MRPRHARGRGTKAKARTMGGPAPEISVVLPVFRESEYLPGILESLSKQDVRSDVVVVVDEPTKETMELAGRYEGAGMPSDAGRSGTKASFSFIFNDRRIGKSAALNEGVGKSKAGIVLFIDSDIGIPDRRGFLRTVIGEMDGVDILDILKVVDSSGGGSYLQRMAYYEYLSWDVIVRLFERFFRRTAVLNGSGFAIRRGALKSLGGFRKVLVEDMDLAIRSFAMGCRFKASRKARLDNYVHSDWKHWDAQRLRWSTGFAEWCGERRRMIISNSVRNPLPVALVLLVMSPTLSLIALNAAAVMLNSPTGIGGLNVALSLAGFLSYSAGLSAFAKRARIRFSIADYFEYYFLHSTVAFATVMFGFANALFRLRKVRDWKV